MEIIFMPTKAKTFCALVPLEVVRVLVHMMLYSMHIEGMTSRSTNQLPQSDQKLVSSVVQRSIYTLATVMHATKGGGEVGVFFGSICFCALRIA